MRIILSFFLISLFFNSSAQYNITGNYNTVHIGKNINLGLSKNINNHTLGIALKYNINNYVTDNQNEVLKKRFFAIKLIEHFVFNLDYQYNFNIKKSPITPFIFYNLQFTNSHTRNQGYLKYGIDTLTNTILYREYLEFWGPTIALENYLGFGYNVDINKKVYIINKIGFGLISYFNIDSKLYGGGDNWELGYMISFGLGYRLYNKEKSP